MQPNNNNNNTASATTMVATAGGPSNTTSTTVSATSPRTGSKSPRSKPHRHLDGRPGSQQLHDDVHRVLRRAMKAGASAAEARNTTQNAMANAASKVVGASESLQEQVHHRKDALTKEQIEIVKAVNALEEALRSLLGTRSQVASKLGALRAPLDEVQTRINIRMSQLPADSLKYTDTAERVLLGAKESLQNTIRTLEGRLLVVEDLLAYMDTTRRTLLGFMQRNRQIVNVNDVTIGGGSVPSSPSSSSTSSPQHHTKTAKAGLIKRRRIPANDVHAGLRVASECIHESALLRAAISTVLRDTMKVVEATLATVEMHVGRKVAENAALVGALQGEAMRLEYELKELDIAIAEATEAKEAFKLPLLVNKARKKQQRSSGPQGELPPEERKRRGGDTIGVPGAAREEGAVLLEGVKVNTKHLASLELERAQVRKVLKEVMALLAVREQCDAADRNVLNVASSYPMGHTTANTNNNNNYNTQRRVHIAPTPTQLNSHSGRIPCPPPPHRHHEGGSSARRVNHHVGCDGDGSARSSSHRSSSSSRRRHDSRRDINNHPSTNNRHDGDVNDLLSGRGSVRSSPRIPVQSSAY